jgi:hypothetical protein
MCIYLHSSKRDVSPISQQNSGAGCRAEKQYKQYIISHELIPSLFWQESVYISSERYGERVDEIQTKRIDPKNPWLRSVSECVIVRYTAFTFSSPPKQDILAENTKFAASAKFGRVSSRDCNKKVGAPRHGSRHYCQNLPKLLIHSFVLFFSLFY